MTQNEENPKVYPVINQGNVYESGMTLRDHFAGLAMQSIILNNNQNIKDGSTNPIYGSFDFLSKEAYEMSDAMLKQRSL